MAAPGQACGLKIAHGKEARNMIHHMRLAGTALLLGLLAGPQDAAAQAANTAALTRQEHLGSVHFSTGCQPEVQSAFEKGVALLDSFQYEEARQTTAICRADSRAKRAKCLIRATTL